MAKELNVFLSSNFKEFENARRYLSREISKIPHLECILQEDKGALSQGPTESSVGDAQRCDILVGILGDHDSKTTRNEIDSVVKLGKYRLIYVKESETRDKKMSQFISELSKHHMVYKTFKKGSGDLYPSVLSNLQDHIYRILIIGLESFEKNQQKIMNDSNKTETETKTKIEKEKYTPSRILQEAEASLKNGHYLATVVECATLLEVAFKEWLIKTKQLPKHEIEQRSIGGLVRMIRNKAIMEPIYIHNTIEISTIRNQALHAAKIPSEQDAKIVLNWTKELLDRLET